MRYYFWMLHKVSSTVCVISSPSRSLHFESINRPVGRAVTRSSLEREVWGSNLGPVKSDTKLPTARHRCDISSNGAVLPGRNDAEMGPANSLHASAYYSGYNERFDLNKFICTVVTLNSPFAIKFDFGEFFETFLIQPITNIKLRGLNDRASSKDMLRYTAHVAKLKIKIESLIHVFSFVLWIIRGDLLLLFGLILFK